MNPGYAVLAEFSGGATSSPSDQIGANTGSASPIAATAGGVDAASGELLVSCGEWHLTKAGSVTTADTYNNGATPTSNLNNDASTTVADHYRFAWGTTTGNSAADQDSQSNNSMNVSTGAVCVASFKLAAAATRTFNAEQGALHDDPFSLQVIQQSIVRGSVW